MLEKFFVFGAVAVYAITFYTMLYIVKPNFRKGGRGQYLKNLFLVSKTGFDVEKNTNEILFQTFLFLLLGLFSFFFNYENFSMLIMFFVYIICYFELFISRKWWLKWITLHAGLSACFFILF